MPVQSDTNGMGAQLPTEKYGVRSPFHAGGGGGGAGGNAAATQELDGASNTVPCPHSVALLIPGETTVMNASGANVAAPIVAKRCILAAMPAPLWSSPTHAQARIIGPTGCQFHPI
jgi:hypothetical protein